MTKQEFMDELKRRYTRVGRTQKVSEESGVTTYDTLVFVVDAGTAGWKTVSWYVLDEDSPHEAAYARRDPEAKTKLQRRVEKAVQAKKNAGKWWTAKIENIDEEERFADVRVSVATARAAEVDERLMRIKEDPEDPDQVVVSRVVDRAKRKLIEKLFGKTDTVDTTTA